MNMNNTCCIDTPNCSCNTCNGCCGGVRVAGCGNPIYNVFRWNGPCHGCCQPEQCAINMLYEYLLKGEAAEIYVTNREFLDFQNELGDTYETKERVAELEQTIQDIQVGPATSQSWDDIEGKPTFATVATSGSYNDLTDKPIIPAQFVQVQADWNQTNSSAADYIKNKPTIPSGIIVDNHLDLSSPNPVQNKVIADEISSMSSSINSLSNAKQNKLVSGTSIKTINNQSILGSGNITIAGEGTAIAVDSALDSSSTNPVQNSVIQAQFGSITTALASQSAAISAIEGVLWNDDVNKIDNIYSILDTTDGVIDSMQDDIDACVETVAVDNNVLKYTTSGGTSTNVATIDTTATKNSTNLVTSGAVLNAVSDSFNSKSKYFKGLGLSSVESVFDIQGQLIDPSVNTRVGYVELTIEWFNAKGDSNEADRLVKKSYVVGKEPVNIENSQWDPSGIISDINSHPGNDTDFVIHSQPSFTYSSSGGRIDVQIHLDLISSKYQVHSITITKVYDPNDVELQIAEAFQSTVQYSYNYTNGPQPGIYIIDNEAILYTGSVWYKIGDAEESPMKPNTQS